MGKPVGEMQKSRNEAGYPHYDLPPLHERVARAHIVYLYLSAMNSLIDW